MKKFLQKTLSIAATLLYAAIATAAPPPNSPYFTDQQFSSNKDSTADALSIITVVSCYVRNMAPEIGYNAVGNKPFVAMVDVNKCDSDNPTSTDDGNLTEKEKKYDTALVEASVDTEGVLSAKIWMSGKDDDNKDLRTWISVRIAGGAEKSPPFGDWEVNWCDDYDVQNNSCPFFGHARVDGTGIRAYHYYSELGHEEESAVVGNISKDQLSGGGKFSRIDSNNGTEVKRQGHYGFEPGLMFAKINDTEQCLIPKSDAPGARFSLWETWLYDRTTGERFDRNSGFSIKDDQGNWGFAGHWGVYVGNNSAKDGQQFTRVNNNTATSETYTAMVTKGLLEKISTSTSSLDSIDGLTLKGNSPKSLLFPGSDNSWISYYFHWKQDEQRFIINSYQECTSTCTTEPLQEARKFSIDELVALNQNNLHVSQEGSNVRRTIVLAEHDPSGGFKTYNSGEVKVRSETRTNVSPGDTTVPSELVCIGFGSCARENLSIENFSQLRSDQVNDFTYTWAKDTGDLKSGTSVLDFTDSDNPYYSGTLVSKVDLNCDGGNCRINEGTVDIYRWQSGPNNWNKFSGIKDPNGKVVIFEQPLMVSYVVPSDDPSEFKGKEVNIQYPGSGNLWIPGYCFNSETNQRVQCDNSTEWANEFSIPFDTTNGIVTAVSDDEKLNGKKFLVKNLRRGVYFPLTNLAKCNNIKSESEILSNLVLPTKENWKNPADPDSAVYIGDWKEATDTPLIIDGKLQ